MFVQYSLPPWSALQFTSQRLPANCSTASRLGVTRPASPRVRLGLERRHRRPVRLIVVFPQQLMQRFASSSRAQPLRPARRSKSPTWRRAGSGPAACVSGLGTSFVTGLRDDPPVGHTATNVSLSPRPTHAYPPPLVAREQRGGVRSRVLDVYCGFAGSTADGRRAGAPSATGWPSSDVLLLVLGIHLSAPWPSRPARISSSAPSTSCAARRAVEADDAGSSARRPASRARRSPWRRTRPRRTR